MKGKGERERERDEDRKEQRMEGLLLLLLLLGRAVPPSRIAPPQQHCPVAAAVELIKIIILLPLETS